MKAEKNIQQVEEPSHKFELFPALTQENFSSQVSKLDYNAKKTSKKVKKLYKISEGIKTFTFTLFAVLCISILYTMQNHSSQVRDLLTSSKTHQDSVEKVMKNTKNGINLDELDQKLIDSKRYADDLNAKLSSRLKQIDQQLANTNNQFKDLDAKIAKDHKLVSDFSQNFKDFQADFNKIVQENGTKDKNSAQLDSYSSNLEVKMEEIGAKTLENNKIINDYHGATNIRLGGIADSQSKFQQKLDKKIEELIEQQTSIRSQFEKITEKQIQDLLALQESQQKSLQNQYEKRMEKHIQEILSVQEAQYSILQNQFEKKIAKQIQDLLDLQESQQASKMN